MMSNPRSEATQDTWISQQEAIFKHIENVNQASRAEQVSRAALRNPVAIPQPVNLPHTEPSQDKEDQAPQQDKTSNNKENSLVELTSYSIMEDDPEEQIHDLANNPIKPYLSSQDMINTLQNIGRIFQLGVAGILTHDYNLFHNHPEQRFANTLGKIFLGSIISANGYVTEFANQNSFINHFGGTRPDQRAAFFSGISASIASPIVLPIIIHLSYTYFINRKSAFEAHLSEFTENTNALLTYAENTGNIYSDIFGWHPLFSGKQIDFQRLIHSHPDTRQTDFIAFDTNNLLNNLLTKHHYLAKISAIHEAYFLIKQNDDTHLDLHGFETNLKNISKNDTFLGFYTDYLLWTLNRKPAHWKNHLYYGVYLLKALDTLSMVASFIRLVMTLADKLHQQNEYKSEESKCEDKFNFNKQVANYLCSICGNWDNINVAYKDLNNLQKCVDALLQQTRDPKEISAKLSAINHKKSPFLTLLLSNRDWASWTDQDFSQLLATLAQFIETQFIVDLSQLKNTTVSDQKILSLASFIRQNQTHTVIFDPAYLTVKQSQTFLKAFPHTTTQEIRFGLANPKTKIDLDYYTLFTQSQLKSAKFQAAILSESQTPSFIRGIFDSNITSLTLKSTYQVSNITPLLFQQAPNSKLQELTLINFLFDLSSDNKATSYPSLTQLALDGSTLESDDFAIIQDSLITNHLGIISTNSVDLTNSYKSYFNLISSQDSKVILLNNLAWKSSTVSLLIHYLESHNPESLSLSGMTCSADLWKRLAKALTNSTLTELIMDSANLDNEKIQIFANEIKRGNSKLKKVVLSNNPFEDEPASILLQVMIEANVTDFSFKGIDLEKIFANNLIKLLPSSQIKSMDLSDTSLGNYLTLILQNTPASLASLDFNDNALSDTVSESSALSLIKPPYPITNLLDDRLSDDAKRNIAASSATNHLIHLGLCNGPSINGQRAFDRVISFTGIETNVCISANLLAAQANQHESLSLTTNSMASGALALLCFGMIYHSCTKPMRYLRNRFFSASQEPEQTHNQTPSYSTPTQRI